VENAIAQCEVLLGEHEGDRASEANVLVWSGGLQAMRGRFEVARAQVARAKTIYQELGLAIAVTDTCGHVLGGIEILADRPREAEQALRQSCEVLREFHQTALLATRAGELADAICRQGRDEEAELWVRVAQESAGDEDLDAKLSWQLVQAKILAKRGAIEEAETLAREMVDLVAQTDALNRHAESLLVLAQIYRLSGRTDEAAELVRKALSLYEQKGNVVAADKTRALHVEAAVAE
jgi:tetratricopeptide (TPR) repeat protein